MRIELSTRLNASEKDSLVEPFLKSSVVPPKLESSSHGGPSLAIDLETMPSDVVHAYGRVKLLHYKPTISTGLLKIPILIVYAMINRYHILDLQHDRSVIKQYLDRGIDVYLIDWGDPGPEDMYETIYDCVGYIDSAIDFIRREHSIDKVSLQGYCQGGTFSAIYAALYPNKIRNLILQAAGIDFSIGEGMIDVWGKYLDADKIVDTLGNVPSDLLNFGFLMLDPVHLMLDKYVKFYEDINDQEKVKNFMRMEKWIFDSPDVPGEVYRQFVNELYKENRLVKNEFELEPGLKINLKRIDMPLLMIVGENDSLMPPESTLAIKNLVSSEEKQTFSVKAGHIGVSVGTLAHKELWPKVVDWIADRSTGYGDKNKATPRKGAAILKSKR